MVDEVTGVVERSVAAITFERFNTRVPVDVHVQSLSPGKLFTAHFANEFTFVGMDFSMTIAISNTGEGFAANWTLK